MSGVEFNPALLLRNRHVQSILASSRLRRLRLTRQIRELETNSQERIITLDDGTRLQGFYTHQPDSCGLVVLFHGWEGSATSTYLLDSARHLWRAGFSVFRLNFRDHGQTHHLNSGIFHSCRIDEVVAAVGQIADSYARQPLLLAGFSLGGNFALRVGLRAQQARLPLAHVLAVSPVIDPASGLEAILSAPWFYNYYFMRKWRDSLRRKGELFPEHGITRELLDCDMRQLTNRLVQRYTEYEDATVYMDGYSIAGSRLKPLAVPATIVTALDDPVIPSQSFRELELSSSSELIMLPYGGHCGFVHGLALNSWIPEFLAQRFLATVQATVQGTRHHPKREQAPC